jgi:FkbM family methyltransferase
LLSKFIHLAKINVIRFVISITQKSVCEIKGSYGIELVRIGSNYGGYWIPKIFLESSNSKSALSLGLGFDVSLDIKLLESGFIVLGVEPTKKSNEFVADFLKAHIETGRFCLVKSAVGGESGQVFYTKPNLKDNYQWWAEEDADQESEGVCIATVTVGDLEILYPRFFEQELVILKMDIEGAEIGVLRNLINRDHRLDYLAVELDYISLVPVKSLLTRIKRVIEVRRILILLERRGYTLLKREEFNFFWINNRHIQVTTHI